MEASRAEEWAKNLVMIFCPPPPTNSRVVDDLNICILNQLVAIRHRLRSDHRSLYRAVCHSSWREKQLGEELNERGTKPIIPNKSSVCALIVLLLSNGMAALKIRQSAED